MKSITQVVENLIKPYTDSHDRAAEAIIAPVETNATSASDDYAVGKQLILNNVLYDVIAPITAGNALVVNTNIKAADNVSTDIEALTKALEDEAATRSALGAKNILPFDLDDIKALNTNGTWAGNVYTYRGVDFTVNSDGTISATGTATGGNASIKTFAASSNYEMLGKEVILNGCPSGGSASTYRIQAYRMASADGSTGTYFDDGAGTDAFTVLNNASGTVGSFAVAVYENTTVTNLLFKPMVRLASDPDDTYQQYAKTNREITAENQTLTNQVKDMNNVYGSKNLLPFNLADIIANNTDGTWRGNNYTRSGVTFTVNDDGSITINGSGTASNNITLGNLPIDYIGKELIMSDNSTNRNAYMFISYMLNGSIQYITDKEFIIPNGASDIKALLHTDTPYSGTTTIYPMIRLASIQDDTYEPYAKTNQQLTKDTTALLDNTEVNGAVNMLDFTQASEVKKGYTFTNTDGVVQVTGSRASGETGNADHDKTITLPKGTYKISGCPSGGSENTWRVLVNINNGAKYAFDYGDGAVFTLTEESTLKVYCTIMSNYSDTVNLTFKPMITVPSYNGDYVPYAKSNKELTEDVEELNTLSELTDASQITVTDSNILEVTSVRLNKKGSVLNGFLVIQVKSALPFNSALLTLPSGFRPSAVSNCIGIEQSTTQSNCGMFGIWPTGDMQLQIGFANFTGNMRIAINAII